MRILQIIILSSLIAFGSCESNSTKSELDNENIKSLILRDTTITFLWWEKEKSKESNDSVLSIVVNEKYCSTISDAEKAALGYVATFIGNDCWWDGECNENRSNLKCKILTALNLGYQCSEQHLGFLRKWFKADTAALKELKDCPTTPYTATIQDTFDEIKITTKGNRISVFFVANGVNLREQKSWKWSETDFFEVSADHIKVLKRERSDIEFNDVKFEESE